MLASIKVFLRETAKRLSHILFYSGAGNVRRACIQCSINIFHLRHVLRSVVVVVVAQVNKGAKHKLKRPYLQNFVRVVRSSSTTCSPSIT